MSTGEPVVVRAEDIRLGDRIGWGPSTVRKRVVRGQTVTLALSRRGTALLHLRSYALDQPVPVRRG